MKKPVERAACRVRWAFCSGICFIQFLCQKHSNLHAVHKSGFLVVPAKGADGIHNRVHLPQGHSAHCLVQFMETSLDLVTVHVVCIVVRFIQKGQDGISIAKVRRFRRNSRHLVLRQGARGVRRNTHLPMPQPPSGSIVHRVLRKASSNRAIAA